VYIFCCPGLASCRRRPLSSNVRRHKPTSSPLVPPRNTMPKLRVESFTISLDGFGAGPDQDINNPLGVGGTSLHGWAIPTRTFQKNLFGNDRGETGVDEDFAARGFQNIGAWILGRNMFGPVRGPWPDEGWRGWWGENPVYHVPVFVLTNHARAPLVMEGGTTFHFVTEGIAAALAQAREAAEGKDVRVGGGVNVIQQYLRQRLIDEMHIAISPVLLGSGERLFEGVNLPALGYACTKHQSTLLATHVVLTRR
jgi:dihydrofolate reductase